jgi:acyl-CoA thioester hydrolase
VTAEKFQYHHPIQVRYADTDAQGHVFFSNYLTFFDEAHGGYFRAIGVPWPRLMEMGLDSYHVSAHCDFKGSAHYEDVLHVHARMTRIGKSSYTLECAIYRENSDELIASGYVTAVIVTRESRQPTRVPEEIREAVARYEGRSQGQLEKGIGS